MTFTLLAQDPAPKQPGPEGSLLGYAPLILIALFMFVILFPAQRRQRREQQQMVAALKRGTRVVTQAGIIGTVDTVKDAEDEMTVRSGDARLKVLKSSVVRVLGQDDADGK